MRPGLSSALRQPADDPEAIALLLESLAPEFVALDGAIDTALFAPLARRLLADAIDRPLRVAFAPCPHPAIGRGKRLPELASTERDERAAAIGLVVETFIRTRDLGVQIVVLPVAGRVALPDRSARVAVLFAKGYLAPGGPAAERFAAWRAERAIVAGRAVDGLRASLERLAREADRHGMRLGLPNVGRYDELPTRDEALLLLGELDGAPIGLWLDTAAAHAKEVLGLGTQEHFLESLAAASRAIRPIGVSLTDAAGLRGGMAPGRGEIDFGIVAASNLAPDASRVVVCSADAYADEVQQALERLDASPSH